MAKKIRQSPKLPAETRREQLLKSAFKLFVKRGYRATTVEEIARKAGLTKGAAYFHFKNKEDILYQLVRGLSAHHRKAFEDALQPPYTPGDFFKTLFSLHTRKKEVAEYWNVADLWIQAVRIPRIKRFLARQMTDVLEAFADNVAPTDKGDRRETIQLAVFLLAVCDGLSLFQAISPNVMDVAAQEKLLDTMLRNRSRTGAKKSKRPVR